MAKAGEVARASDVTVQACRVTRAASQSIADSTDTTVAFTAEHFDTDGMHSTVTNNSRITINTAGIYVVGFSGQFAASSAYTLTMASLYLNIATLIDRQLIPGTSTSVPQRISISTVYEFDVGDYIEVNVYQTSGASRSLEVASEMSPVFYAARMGSGT